MGTLIRTDNALLVPPHRPRDALRLVDLGRQLGEALDAGTLPATAAAAPGSRLVDVIQEPKPLVVWAPTRWQLRARALRRFLARFR